MTFNCNNKLSSKFSLVIVLILSFCNYSCYYYIEVSSQEIHNKNYTGTLKIEKKDKSELEFKTKDADFKDSSLIIHNESVQYNIPVSDIGKYYQERFDILATIMVIPVIIIFSGLVLSLILPRINFGG